MVYSIGWNGKKYNLTPYTVKIAEQFENASVVSNSDVTMSEKLNAVCSALYSALGYETSHEILGDIDNADPNEISILFLTVAREYERPMREFTEKQKILNIGTDDLGKVTELVEAIEKLKTLKRSSK